MSLLVLGALVAIGAPPLPDGGSAVVRHLEGSASAAGRPLLAGARVATGELVKTGAESRLELGFRDGSRLRLGPESELTLDVVEHAGEARRAVRGRLGLGRVWATVVRSLGGGTFEIETQNAVSGVRGTSFTVLALADSAAIVRVYAGTVGVKKKGDKGGPRTRIPGPKRIDRADWEGQIATAMKEIRVSALGEISPATDFVEQGEDTAWAAWNRARDAVP